MKVDPTELVAPADIADMFGVRLNVVSNWRSRFKSFPEPVAVVARGQTLLYRRRDVQAWMAARETARGQRVNLDERIRLAVGAQRPE